MYENLSIQEYLERMQQWDFEQEIKVEEVIERSWEDNERMGKIKTKKATKELMEAFDNGK